MSTDKPTPKFSFSFVLKQGRIDRRERYLWKTIIILSFCFIYKEKSYYNADSMRLVILLLTTYWQF